MAVKVTFGGNPVTLVGNPISVGDKAPNFTALNQDLSPFSLYEETEGKATPVPRIPVPPDTTNIVLLGQDSAEHGEGGLGVGDAVVIGAPNVVRGGSHKGNVSAAARVLGIDRGNLHKKMKKLGIKRS